LLDFDLESFNQSEEITMLEQDYNLDLLCLLVCILDYVKNSEIVVKLLNG